MGDKTLDYATRIQPRRPFSRWAIVALPVALLGFPLLPPLVFEQELLDLRQAWQLDGETVFVTLLVAWPLVCMLPSIVALIRFRRHRGSQRGRGLALAGLWVSLFWLVMLVLFGLYQLQAPDVMGPL